MDKPLQKSGGGYSSRSLIEKLGLKSSHKGLLVNPPLLYLQYIKPLPEGIVIGTALEGPLDFIHIFTMDLAELEQQLPALKPLLSPTGMLWISWPKKTSKLHTNLTDNLVREIGLRNGLVDIKVCAIDQNWSALKFVYRKSDRATNL